MAFCGPSIPVNEAARRFDDLDAAHQKLLVALRAMEEKLGDIYDAICNSQSPVRSRCHCEAETSREGLCRPSDQFKRVDSDTPLVERKESEPRRGSAPALCQHMLCQHASTTSTARSVVAQSSVPLCRRDEPPSPGGGRSPRRASIASGASLGESLWLEMRPGFDSPPSRRSSGRITLSLASSSITRWRSRHSVHSDESISLQENCRWKAWNPDSMSRTIFEVLSMVMLLFDAFIMPYVIAWDVSTEGATFEAAIWTTRIFWTLDLAINFLTGFRDKEAKLELHIRRAVRHYTSTWFLPDLALVTCDWLTFSNNSVSSGNKWIQWMRVMRLVRGGRQVIRGWTLVLKARIVIQMKIFHLVMDIALLMLIILWVNHMVCCGWYIIGRYYESDTGSTWLSTQDYSAGGEYYDYLTALHWAMCQMTPGSMEVSPRSSAERIYNVFILLLGLLMGSSLIATLTSMMTQYKLRFEASSRKFLTLQQFLNQQAVDPQLALAIKLQVKARSNERERLKAKDVEYLGLLSNSLQDALWHGWCMRHLSAHAFLNSLNILDSFAVQSLCKTVIKSMEFPASDAIFEEGAIGDFMYFVVAGRLRFIPGELAPEMALPDGDPKLTLKSGDWCSEPALWTVWTHLGTLEAMTTAEVLAVSGPLLTSALNRFPVASSAMTDYCATFHRYINEPGVLRSDLSYTFDINELLSGLTSETRMQLAAPLLQRLETRFWDVLNHGSMDRLKEEVDNGKCDIGPGPRAEVVRNTFVVALRISRFQQGSDRFLVKIGEVLRDGNRVVGSCLLPGVKRKWRENYPTAVARLLQNDLGEIASHVETYFSEGGRQTVSMNASPTYGIRTRYLRTTFAATLDSDARLTMLVAPKGPLPLPAVSGIAWLFRRESRRYAAVQQQVAAVLAEHREVAVLHCDKTNRASRKLYLWLTPEEFEVLSDEMATPIIEQWLSSLEASKGQDSEDKVDLGKDFSRSPLFTLAPVGKLVGKVDSDSGSDGQGYTL